MLFAKSMQNCVIKNYIPLVTILFQLFPAFMLLMSILFMSDGIYFFIFKRSETACARIVISLTVYVCLCFEFSFWFVLHFRQTVLKYWCHVTESWFATKWYFWAHHHTSRWRGKLFDIAPNSIAIALNAYLVCFLISVVFFMIYFFQPLNKCFRALGCHRPKNLPFPKLYPKKLPVLKMNVLLFFVYLLLPI